MVQRMLIPRKVTKEGLNVLVNKAADLIRTAVDYKFILILLFMKRLNSLSDESISKVIDAYRKFSETISFFRVVSMKKVTDNDYNLSVTLYGMSIEEEPINTVLDFSTRKNLDVERQEVEKELEEYISRLSRLIGE